MRKVIWKTSFAFILMLLLIQIFPDISVYAASNNLEGVTLKDSTAVYESTSTTSKKLKTYESGKILKFQAYTSEWYKATVYVNGVKKNGYISNKDVDILVNKQSAQGYAQIDKMAVYTQPMKKSSVLKTYPAGQTIKYSTFSSQWHKATVIVNGVRKTGYIYASDVGKNQPSMSGYGVGRPTYVLQSPHTGYNTSLKSYLKGTKLKFSSYNSEWYKATVYVNGKKKTGYIYKKDISIKAPALQGYAKQKSVSVYSQTSKKSKPLKSYKMGTTLKYTPYNKDWYKATVRINGKSTTGYIAVSDISNEKPKASMNHVEKLEDEYERKVIELTNKERTKRGLPALKRSVDLTEVAKLKSSDMYEKGYFDHTSPTYGSVPAMLDNFKIRGNAVGENIASGYETPEDVVKGWMDSPPHRSSILSKSFTHIGVGYHMNGSYWTQEFIEQY